MKRQSLHRDYGEEIPLFDEIVAANAHLDEFRERTRAARERDLGQPWKPLPVSFDGETIDPSLDEQRLGRQQEAVRAFMERGGWHTLAELSAALGYPEASISARIRDLRKPRWGARTVERRRRGEPKSGLFEYRLL